MKKLSIIILGNSYNLKENEDIEIIYSDGKNLKKTVSFAQGKYITFINSNDIITDDYLVKILDKCSLYFDCCYINSKINYEYLSLTKTLKNSHILKDNKPYAYEYIWNYVYLKEKLLILLNRKNKDDINRTVDNIFIKTTAISDILYYHNPKNEKIIKDSLLLDQKPAKYFKNIIYVGNHCNGVFNGYISWLNNIGRCFSEEYKITILYDNLPEETYKSFQQYFHLEKYNKKINYTTDRLLTTFSTYYYPKNIFPLESSYLFIHANMSDYKNAIKYNSKDDNIYTEYIAVSKEAAKKAEGYFPTNNIKYIYNPFKIDKHSIKPHLKLISAQRSSNVKKIDRIKHIAEILDEEKIPYTWNIFTDTNEGKNQNGLIYRNRTNNPLPYIKDSDYFVLLSDSEACPYSILEALELNTKVIVTPLKVYEDLGIKNRENGFIIPFEYFKGENKEKLRKLVKEIYKNKELTFNYKYNSKNYEEYNKIFKE